MKFIFESDGTLEGSKLFINGAEVSKLSEVNIIMNESVETISFEAKNPNIDERMIAAGYKKTEDGEWIIPDERVN